MRDRTELAEPEEPPATAPLALLPLGTPSTRSFFLNPHDEFQFTRCPECGETTKVRSVYLVTLFESGMALVINQQARLCESCDLLIAHEDELEFDMANVLEDERRLDLIGTPYIVAGTLDRAGVRALRRSQVPADPRWVLSHTELFAEQVTYRLERGPGWYLPHPQDEPGYR